MDHEGVHPGTGTTSSLVEQREWGTSAAKASPVDAAACCQHVVGRMTAQNLSLHAATVVVVDGVVAGEVEAVAIVQQHAVAVVAASSTDD